RTMPAACGLWGTTALDLTGWLGVETAVGRTEVRAAAFPQPASARRKLMPRTIATPHARRVANGRARDVITLGAGCMMSDTTPSGERRRCLCGLTIWSSAASEA